MPAWPTKDPEAVLDYLYTIPLDEGDTVQSSTFEKLSGDVVIDSQSRVDDEWTATLSGGTDGETAVFRVAWVTVLGRVLDDIITLAVVANEITELLLTGYAKPTPWHLIQRYPAFDAVDVATIQFWLTDAERSVDESWLEGDYAVALMSLAAHNMALAGLGVSGAGALPYGVTRFKSGAMDVTIAESAASRQAAGGHDSTVYGREFKLLQRRSFGGPSVVAAGTTAVCGSLS